MKAKRREISLCAGRPFTGVKGKRKSACSVRNDEGRGARLCRSLSSDPQKQELSHRLKRRATTRARADFTRTRRPCALRRPSVQYGDSKRKGRSRIDPAGQT